MLDNLQHTGRMKIVMTNTLWMDLKVLKWKSFDLVLRTGSILKWLDRRRSNYSEPVKICKKLFSWVG